LRKTFMIVPLPHPGQKGVGSASSRMYWREKCLAEVVKLYASPRLQCLAFCLANNLLLRGNTMGQLVCAMRATS
jgi:hypothetical protein